MTQRSTPQRVVDDRAFPIRVNIVTPGSGFGQRMDVYLAWLKQLGPEGSAWHSDRLYFRSLDAAAHFFAYFPEVVMSDYTETRSRSGRIS